MKKAGRVYGCETSGEHRKRVDQQQRRQAETRAAETPEEHGERVEQKCVRQAELRYVELPQ